MLDWHQPQTPFLAVPRCLLNQLLLAPNALESFADIRPYSRAVLEGWIKNALKRHATPPGNRSLGLSLKLAIGALGLTIVNGRIR